MLTQRILVSYTTFRLKDAYWQLEPAARKALLTDFLAGATGLGQAVACYQVFPARAEYDILIWATQDCEELTSPDRHFAQAARCINPYRQYLDIPLVLCGITKPSTYVKPHENPQELNPYDQDRKPYFVIYPFTKTAPWYLLGREERQQMMAGHIRLGKTYPSIKQLLIYSFGIQDQEFVVAYEMEDLPLFSDLVQALRSTEARIYTAGDTPIITGTLRSAAELVELFGGETRK